jgi:DNA primase
VRRIPQETIEQVAAATDIVELIGGYFPLRRAGATYKALCPFHQEKSPSFTVNPHRQIFKCFGCGAGGSVFRFVMDYEHIEFGAAVRKLADKAGIRIVEEELSPEENAKVDLRRRLLAMHAEAAEFFHQQLMRTQSAQIARAYLKGRGISPEVAKSWKLGYAPDSWDALSSRLEQEGFTHEEIAKSGLVSTKEDSSEYYDRFRNRVMFPISNDTGEVIAFSGRVLEADAKAAKYVNSSETILFTKGAVLFGLNKSKRALIDKKSAIVCEGQLDLITAFEAGIQNVIAPQGTAFTDKQARILKRYVDEVVLCFDADAAGQKAAERSLSHLMAESLAVRVIAMPPGEDPDSLIRKRGAEAFLALVGGAQDFFDFQLDRMAATPDFATPKGKALAARQLAGWIHLIADPVMRQAVLNKATIRLEISTAQLGELVKRSPSPVSSESDDLEAKPVVKLPELEPTLKLLALAALHDDDARSWLLEEDWPSRLAAEPDSELLVTILKGDFQPSDSGSLQSFLTTLDSTEENAITGLLSEKPPVNPLVVTRDCWNDLERKQIRRQMQALQARLRNPVLESEEIGRLQKEILDRQKRLLDIAPPLSPPL